MDAATRCSGVCLIPDLTQTFYVCGCRVLWVRMTYDVPCKTVQITSEKSGWPKKSMKYFFTSITWVLAYVSDIYLHLFHYRIDVYTIIRAFGWHLIEFKSYVDTAWWCICVPRWNVRFLTRLIIYLISVSIPVRGGMAEMGGVAHWVYTPAWHLSSDALGDAIQYRV